MEIDVNEVFDTDSDQSVDFEIIFASVMASTLLAISGISPSLDKWSVFAALGLLLFTMTRRMAIDNPYSAEDKIMVGSIIFIFVLTAYGVVYISIYLTSMFQQWIDIAYLPVISLFLFILPYAALLLYEFVYRDFFLWASIITYNKTEGASYGQKLIDISLSASTINQNEIPEPLKNINSSETPTINTGQRIGITMAIIAFMGILYAITWILTYYVIDMEFVQALLLLASSMPLMGMLEFWYSRHGNSSHSDLTSLYLRIPYFTVVLLTVYRGQF
ncbi:hypothetical protein [Natronorubrum sp. FCH18a]|uniref:hypothetical protein n=1 Tax=Natronorubrum sp. FCH18a TaxID=3447018 RepID=UPI003F50FB75